MFRRIFLPILILILVVVAGAILYFSHPIKGTPEETPLAQNTLAPADGNPADRLAGRMESVIDYGKKAAVSVHYPVFDKPNTDKHLKAYADTRLGAFRAQLSAVKDTRQKPEFFMDYTSWESHGHYATVVFKSQSLLPGQAHPDSQVQSYVFDLDKDAVLTLPDMVNARGISEISRQCAEDIEKNTDWSNQPDAEKIRQATQPDMMHLGNIGLKDQSLAVYFQKYQVLPGSSGDTEVDIPLTQLRAELLLPLLPATPSPSPSPTPAPTPEPTPSRALPDPQKPMIALTFDDGPHPLVTAQVLEALKKNDAHATFFMLGNRAGEFPALCRQVAQSGNEVGDHSFAHRMLSNLSPEALKKDIADAQNAIRNSSGVTPSLLRPPYGSVNDTMRKQLDIPMVLWNIDTEDWKSKNAAAIASHVLSKAKSGDIVLMHDIYPTTAEALKTLLPELKKRGFQIVTVSDMFAARQKQLRNGGTYFSTNQ